MNALVRLAFGTVLLTTAVATAAPQEPCKAQPLGDLIHGRRVLSLLLRAGTQWGTPPDGTTDAQWQADRQQAFVQLEALLQQCDVNSQLVQPDGEFFKAVYSPYADLDQTLRKVLARYSDTTPVLADILRAGTGGIPIPQRLQLGLSQVITAGQPGLAANAAGVINPTGDYVWRHLSVAGSLLVVQPGTSAEDPSATTPPSPEFGSGELSLVFTTTRTAYDWTDEFGSEPSQSALNAAEEEAGMNATRLLLQRYATLHNPQQGEDAEKSRRSAIASAVKEALVLYQEAVYEHIRKQAAKEAKLAEFPIRFSAAAKGRVSSQPRFVPELPDLLSGGVEASVSGGTARRDSNKYSFWFDFRGAAAYSAYSTRQCRSFTDCDPGSTSSLLLDVTGGIALGIPTTEFNMPALLRVGASARVAPGRTIVIDPDKTVEGDERNVADFSWGWNASLSVPVTETLWLVGTYTHRYPSGQRSFATTGFSFSKEFP